MLDNLLTITKMVVSIQTLTLPPASSYHTIQRFQEQLSLLEQLQYQTESLHLEYYLHSPNLSSYTPTSLQVTTSLLFKHLLFLYFAQTEVGGGAHSCYLRNSEICSTIKGYRRQNKQNFL